MASEHNPLLTGGKFAEKMKSRSFLLVCVVLLPIVGKALTLPPEMFNDSLIGLATILGACSALLIGNKYTEGRIVKYSRGAEGEISYEEDTKAGGDEPKTKLFNPLTDRITEF